MPKDPVQSLIPRPPVVAIMGHVDHGKSSLLDYIRKTNVVATEAGGITQHLSAYEITHTASDGTARKITFIDTPGHAAFSGMRTRGAAAADIAILLISAEEGVKTQTKEAIKTILHHRVPFLVAINKIDRPNANPERVKNDLLEAGVYVEGFGGDVPVLLVSAKTGAGVEELLETILLISDMEGFTGNPEKPAEGFIIEANADPKRGVSATLIVKDGTLRQGQYIASGDSFASTRIMEDFAGHAISSVTFSQPVRIVGFSSIPDVGGIFQVFDTKRDAEDCARTSCLAKISKSPDRIIGEDDVVSVIPIIIKADVSGTAEAIENEVRNLSTDDVWLKIVKIGVGDINEDDVKMALADPNSIILGFNVSVDRTARDCDGFDGISIQIFTIIYKLTEWITTERDARKPKTSTETITGKVQVLKHFSSTKNRHLAGGRVTEGVIAKNAQFRMIRNTEIIGTGTIESIQKGKTETSRCEIGDECGFFAECEQVPQTGDILEFFIPDQS